MKSADPALGVGWEHTGVFLTYKYRAVILRRVLLKYIKINKAQHTNVACTLTLPRGK